MAEYSFDIVSKVDEQELDNAINQVQKEIATRFDFKGSKSSVERKGLQITLIADDEMKLKNVIDIVQSKVVRRGLSLKAFDYGKVETASGGTLRQVLTVKQGIPKDKARPLIEKIKAAKLKVNAQVQDEQIRVSAKDKDELQKVIAMMKALDFELPLQFVNYR